MNKEQPLEEQLIDALKNNESLFMSLLFKNYRKTFYNVAYELVENRVIAEEAVQEAFIKIWRKRDHYNSERARLYTWMRKIVYYTAIDQKVKFNRKDHLSDKLDCPDTHIYISGRDLNTDTIDMDIQLAKLEFKYREVIVCTVIEGYTQIQTAERLCIPLGTVKSRYAIGIRELKKIYSEKQ